MIFHPPVIALLIGSLLTSFLLLYAAWYAVVILRHWQITSGSELQLELERKTYLISTLVGSTLVFQLPALLLLVYTAEELSKLLVGAMCAAGTFNVNGYGYPALLLKIVLFMVAGVWMVLNHVDNQARDYPLIKAKYALLLVLAPLAVAETVVMFLYFRAVTPDIITSCCSTIFRGTTEAGEGDNSLLAYGLQPATVCFSLLGLLLVVGIYGYVSKGRGGVLFAAISAITGLVAIKAMISTFSLYFYELPTHHCPFCLLQREYGYTGYPLYLALFVGTVAGISVGAIAPARTIPTLKAIVPGTQRRVVVFSLLCYALFTALVLFKCLTSHLIME